MSKNRIICRCNNIDYMGIRKLMVMGARTLEDVKARSKACNFCQECEDDINHILGSLCGCRNVSMNQAVEAVKGGATSIEEVSKLTGAGTECQRCKLLIKDILERGY